MKRPPRGTDLPLAEAFCREVVGLDVGLSKQLAKTESCNIV
jgi:hypothetical protein